MWIRKVVTSAFVLSIAACGTELHSPTPSLAALTPSLVCNDQLTTEVVVHGGALSPVVVDALTKAPSVTLPTLTLRASTDLVGGDMTGDAIVLDDAVNVGRVRWTDATTMAFDVDAALALPQGVYDLDATNLDGQTATVTQALAVVPPPTATLLDPGIVCLDQHPEDVVLTGTGLLSVDGALPTLELGGLTLTASAVDGCEALTGDHIAEAIQRCTSATFTLPQGSLTPGVYDAVVRNPAPAACASTEPVRIEVVPAPTLESVTPALVCNAQGDESLSATGTGFLSLPSGLPTVDIGGWSGTASGLTGCVSLTGPVQGESCDGLDLTVPEGSLAEGLLDVVVQNPEPADCVTLEHVVIENVPPPVVFGLSQPSVCVDAPDTTITLTGEGFVQLSDGTLPSVSIGGFALSALGVSGCEPLLGPDGGWSCTDLDVLIDAGTFPDVGTYTVVVTNPAPADCASTDTVDLVVTPPPTVTSVSPDSVCASGGTFTVHGTGFAPDASVTIGGEAARSVTWNSAEELLVDAPAALPLGNVDVVVSNADGCSASLAGALQVVGGPILFFVDPPVVYGGVDTLATLLVSGIQDDITAVWIEDAAGTRWDIPDFTWDGENVVTAALPVASLGLGDGAYTVHLSDATSCQPYLDNAFTVESDLTIDVTSMRPAYGWTGDSTAVSVLAQATPGAGLEGFQDLPRVYLSPVVSGQTSLATPLRSVTYVGPDRLDAVVPPGLAPDDQDVAYDVIVVNPDGAIGLIAGGYTATVLPPPVVTSASPSRLPANTNTTVTLVGANFRGPSVDLVCVEPTGTTVTHTATVNSGASDADTLVMTANAGNEGSVCVVRVTNDDGTSFDYSAVSARSASGNLFGFDPTSTMVVARRAPGTAAARATAVSRFLYAVGGDSGALTGALDSVERAPVDFYGDAGAWSVLPDVLPEPRTMAGLVTVGDFLYLVGGHDGVGPVDTIWRAEVLDPQAAPEFANLSIRVGTGQGLGGGTWTYRIAALFGPSDARNPGGESLASDPIVVRLPDLQGGVELDLSWTAVPGATAYRVYRSPAAGNADVVLISDTPSTSLLDDGTAAPDSSRRPLPSGALGHWHEVGTLPGSGPSDAAREAPCVTVATDPVDDTLSYIVVAGGRDGNGTDRDTVSVITIDTASQDQDLLSVVDSAVTLATARRSCSAMTVDDRYNSVVGPGESWIYVVGGFRGNAAQTTAEAFRVDEAGDLVDYSNTLVDDIVPGRAGSASGAAGDYLFILGGQGGGATANGSESHITGPPDLANWNSLGGSAITTPRVFAGSAQENAVLFIVGGTTNTTQATASVELSHF